MEHLTTVFAPSVLAAKGLVSLSPSPLELSLSCGICFPTISPAREEETQVSMTTISAPRLGSDRTLAHL